MVIKKVSRLQAHQQGQQRPSLPPRGLVACVQAQLWHYMKSRNLGSDFRKRNEVHEKAARILSCCFLIPGAELQLCPRSWSLSDLRYRHFHTFLADPDLALLTWLPSLTSGLSHYSRLPWWSFGWPWLLSSNLLCLSSYSTVGLRPLLAKLWLQPVTVDPGSPLAEQPLLLLSNRRLQLGG